MPTSLQGPWTEGVSLVPVPIPTASPRCSRSYGRSPNAPLLIKGEHAMAGEEQERAMEHLPWRSPSTRGSIQTDHNLRPATFLYLPLELSSHRPLQQSSPRNKQHIYNTESAQPSEWSSA